jgi:hypothetical protein
VTDPWGLPACIHCGASVAPGATRCSSCGKELADRAGATVLEPSNGDAAVPPPHEVSPPDPDERPPRLFWIEGILLGVILLIGMILNFRTFAPDRQQILSEWTKVCLEHLKSGTRPDWKRQMPWPPAESVNLVSVLPPVEEQLDAQVEILFRGSGANSAKGESVFSLTPQDERKGQLEALLQSKKAAWLVVRAENGWTGLGLRVSYFAPDLPGVASFDRSEFRGILALYTRPLTNLAVLVLLASAARQLYIQRFRRRHRLAYEEYQRALTSRRFAEKADLEEARRLAEQGEVAKALVRLNRALASNPRYPEAAELKHLLLTSPEVTQGAVVKVNGRLTSHSAGSGPTLYLRVLGTPYAYRAPPGADSIFVGRQRRETGDPLDVGNDVVVRVPGSDQASLRISRRHLQIQRIGNDYFVSDKSHGMTKLNGLALKENEPSRIRSGDRLVLGGVITLEVLLRSVIDGSPGQKMLEASPGTGSPRGVVMEATLGDMLTEVFDA